MKKKAGAPLEKDRPVECWSVQHKKLLEYREILEHWRDLEKVNPTITLNEARAMWLRCYRGDFMERWATSWAPDLVTDFLDVLPFSKLDLRLAALRHDIRYTKGGDSQSKLTADILLRADIIKDYPRSWYAVNVASLLVYLGVRTPIADRHFCWGPKSPGLADYEAFMYGGATA